MVDSGDKTARRGLSVDEQELVPRYIPLAMYLARSYRRLFPSLVDDLKQEALLALVEAVSRYDAARGVAIERWIAYRVKGALADFLRQRDELSQTERERLNEVRAWQEDAARRFGRPPSPLEVAGVILAATVPPQWMVRDVRRLRQPRWKRLEEQLQKTVGDAAGKGLIGATTSKEEFLEAPVTVEEIADVLDAALAIGARETVSTEDLPEYQPASLPTAMTDVGLRKDLLLVDKCFAELPVKQRLIVRLEFAGVPTKIGALALGVSLPNAYVQFNRAKTKLAELVGAGNETGGKRDGKK